VSSAAVAALEGTVGAVAALVAAAAAQGEEAGSAAVEAAMGAGEASCASNRPRLFSRHRSSIRLLRSHLCPESIQCPLHAKSLL